MSRRKDILNFLPLLDPSLPYQKLFLASVNDLVCIILFATLVHPTSSTYCRRKESRVRTREAENGQQNESSAEEGEKNIWVHKYVEEGVVPEVRLPFLLS